MPRAASPLPGMRFVPGGRFFLGSELHYPEEAPRLAASVQPFWMDRHAVTNADFSRFVEQTGYRTLAERAPDPAGFPGVDPELLVPGSLVFRVPSGPVDLRVPTWWTWVPGASWAAPEGPGSSIERRENHPVVHVSAEDAATYARWAGKRLPTEAQWEFAARGGLAEAEYAWGAEFAPGGRQLANTWQGEFPHENLCLDGYAGTAPVGSYPANPYGLCDLIGNVWEWTTTSYLDRRGGTGACCSGPPPGRGEPGGRTSTRSGPRGDTDRLVLKGGSYLCAPNYCARYRPAARVGQDVETGTGHTGFRCVSPAAGLRQ